MSTEVTLPELGEDVKEATVSRWLVEVGEEVEEGDALVEVSTDKVDTEIPAPASGVLLEVRMPEDSIAAIGAVLGVIGDSTEATAPAAPAAPATAPAPATPPPPPAAAAQAAATAVTGTEVTLPELGEDVKEATVSRWLVEVGEEVGEGDALVEVSTDKVDTEIPAPASGVLIEVRMPEDSIASVGAVLGVIGSADALQATPEPTPAAPAPATPVPAPVPAPASAPVSAPVEPSVAAPAHAARGAESAAEGVYVTPLVRKIAAQNNINLTDVHGSGVGGRIRKEDVLAAVETRRQAEEAARAAAAAAAEPAATTAPAAQSIAPDAKRGSTEQLSRLRKIIATRMTESLSTAAQLTATVEVDLTAVSQLRNKVKDDFKRREGASLTYLAFIAKAVAELLKQFATFNASIDVDAGTVTYHATENIGIAVDTDRGLMVPVVKGAGDLNLTGLAKQIGDLGARTRAGKVQPDELSGGTFTITNYGSAGALWDTPIINHPEVAILGTGALVKRPVVAKDAFGLDTIAIRDMMYLSLTYDHRLIDGAKAAQFLSALKARLEDGDFSAEFGL